jgi:hypothetical protein
MNIKIFEYYAELEYLGLLGLSIDQWNNYAYILLKRIYDDHI